jgi:phage shock protein E
MKSLRVLVSVLLVGASVVFAADSPTKNVDVDQFDKLRENKANVILDVRTEKEFKSGHIPGATLVDVNSPDFNEKIAKLDKSKTYLVHCAAGVRSAKACGKLEAAGFTNVVHLPAGFRGWEKAGKPIEK